MRLLKGLSIFKIFYEYMYVIKDEMAHIKINLQNLYRFSSQTGQIQIRIRYNYSGSDSTWLKSSQYDRIRIHNSVQNAKKLRVQIRNTGWW